MDADAMTGVSSRVSLPIVVAIGFALIIAGCSTAPSAGGSVIASSSVAVSPSTPASASPVPAGLDSTTVGATAAPAGSILVEMTGPPPHYVPNGLSATAGDVVFFLDNTSRATHTLAIGPRLYQLLAVSRAIRIGDTAVFTVHSLPAGQYVIWCTISNHAAEGMTGTLTVN